MSENTKPVVQAAVEAWNELTHQQSDGSLDLKQVNDVVSRLPVYTVEPPTVRVSERLTAFLRTTWEVEAPAAGERISLRRRRHVPEWAVLAHLFKWIRPQLRLFSWPFWLLSAVIVLLGLALGALRDEGAGHPLIFAAPLLAALSVCFAFRSYGTPMFELELSFPITPAQLIFGRLTLIIVYDSALLALASLLAAGTAGHVLIFMVNWLVPLGFAAFMALAVMLYFGVGAGLIVSLAVWVLQLVGNRGLGVFYLFSSETDARWLVSKVTCCAFAALLCLAAWRKAAKLRIAGRLPA